MADNSQIVDINNDGGGDGAGNGSVASARISNINSGAKTELDGSVSQSKPSGIPGISKIARPCAGHHKPPVPSTPTKSNNSVLTEDTDSFIIGNHVWVGGTKPGQIAYIGETQFAPGEWAGIVLSQPIGKNDGSVGGVRYFQCEPKCGVFSRLTRLTRTATPGIDDVSICSSIYATPSTPFNNGVRKRVESPMSPTGSIKSSLRSPPTFSVSNTSLSSIPHVIDFKVGDRVIIKSSQGSKVGTLRYIGVTEFAPGEWCGVELDEPRGKNNGSVDGKRYFECAPQFGLFAPASKVSKSPMKYKPGNCVIHSSAGNVGNQPLSGIKRMGSKESITSLTSSITSAASGARRVRLGINSLTPQKATPKPITPALATRSALQDVLREKQQHIEQLLKERDLDRTEFTKAATHAEELGQKLGKLTAEHEQYRLETEGKLREYVEVLTKLNKDRSITLSQLDDEKRKNEDLQFRFEEAAITKGDIEVNSKSQVLRIQELEAQLIAERQKLNNYEGDSSKLFEAEEALVETREELDALKKQLQDAVSEKENLSKTQTSSSKSNTDLKENLEKITVELHTVKQQNSIEIEKLKQELANVSLSNTGACNELTKQIDNYVVQLQEKSDICQNQTEQIATLRLELEQNKDLVKQATNQLQVTSETESKLTLTIEKLKQEISSKVFDYENSTDVIKQKEDEIVELKAQCEKVLSDSRISGEEVDLKFKNEIELVRKELCAKSDEFLAVNEKLQEASKSLADTIDKNRALSSELQEAKEQFERTVSDNKAHYEKQIEAKTTENMQIASQVSLKTDEINNNLAVIKQLQDDITAKAKSIDDLQNEVSVGKKHLESETSLTSKLNEQVQSLQLNTGDLQRKVTAADEQIKQLTEQKTHLETDISNLMSSSGDYNDKMQKLAGDLKAKDDLLAVTKSEFVEKVQQLEHTNQDTQLRLQSSLQEVDRLKLLYEEKLQGTSVLQERLEKNTGELVQAQTELKDLQGLLYESQSQKKLADEAKVLLESDLIAAQNTSKENCVKIEQLSAQLLEQQNCASTIKTESEQNVLRLKESNQQLQMEIDNLKLAKTSDEEQIKLMLESEKGMQETVSEFNKAQLRIAELQGIISEHEKTIKASSEEALRLTTDLDNAASLSGDTNATIQQLSTEIALKENALTSTTEKLAEASQDLEKTKQELSELHTTKTELDTKLQTSTKAYQDLQEQYDTIFADKQKTDLDLIALREVLSDQELSLKEKSENETYVKQQLEQTTLELQEISQVLTKTKDDLINKNTASVQQLAQITDAEHQLKQERLRSTQLEDELAIATKTNAHVKQLTEDLQAAKQLTTQLQIDKGNLELEKIDAVKQLSANDQNANDLANRIVDLNQKIEREHDLSENLQAEKRSYTQILENLELTEKQKERLVTRLSQGNNEHIVLDLVKSIQVNAEETQPQANLVELHRSLEATRQDLKDSKSLLHNKQNEVLRLQDALTKAENNNNNHNTNDHKQLLEEKQLAEGQVQFLNAIIVDMQRKNEEQRIRIELLESGFSPAAASELKLYGMPQGAIAPRMYCDICEEFDKHDTEDCPVQGNDFDAPAIHTNSKKSIPDRPYCDICEAFGHSTEDCKEDETY